ncbi:MAG: AAA family ATPase, partial [Chloroflexota bacterium]|nr:AAA family ATPase [Chloroflexota bacterium]
MSETAARTIRKFNPGTFQSDEEVIEQFVVRQRELDSVLDVVRGNIDAPSCQHLLVVAPRGRGKTMLLARVAAEIRTDDELSQHVLPVRFMEESPEIFDMADFWLEALFHLAKESARQEPKLTRELRASHAALAARWRDQAVEDSARAIVLSAADRLGKKLVLMVENLQSLVENTDRDLGWKLRAVLQSEPQIMLLASSTSRFEGLDDASQPFFELFRTVGLEPLSTGECARLWTVVSGERIDDG